MKLKTGDKVRFLNEAVEGTISRLLPNERVEVIDSHGFTHISEEKHVVLIELVFEKNQLDVQKTQNKEPEQVKPTSHKSTNDLIQSLEIDNTIYVAIRLMNEKSPLTTDIELHVINNTIYSIGFTVAKRLEDIRYGVGSGNLKPRNEQFIGIFSQDEMHRFEGFEFQFIFYGKNEYKPRPPAVKGLQFTSTDFINTDYRKLFYNQDDTVLLMPLYSYNTEDNVDLSKLLDKYKREELEEEKRNAANSKNKSERFTVLTRQKVVDLHIEELMKDHSNMNNAQIISYQINYFMYEMDQALMNKLHMITFIHGVGNGVLRSSIREELKRFPNIKFREAPAEKFGYGATEVEFL